MAVQDSQVFPLQPAQAMVSQSSLCARYQAGTDFVPVKRMSNDTVNIVILYNCVFPDLSQQFEEPRHVFVLITGFLAIKCFFPLTIQNIM